MIALLASADILLLAVLASDQAHRKRLSTAVLFLAGGFALANGMLGAIHIDPGEELVGLLGIYSITT